MSKKNRHNFQQVNPKPAVNIGQSHAAEYRGIRNDLIRVAVLNLIFLAAVLVVYFTDRSSPYLERIYNQIF